VVISQCHFYYPFSWEWDFHTTHQNGDGWFMIVLTTLGGWEWHGNGMGMASK